MNVRAAVDALIPQAGSAPEAFELVKTVLRYRSSATSVAVEAAKKWGTCEETEDSFVLTFPKGEPDGK